MGEPVDRNLWGELEPEEEEEEEEEESEEESEEEEEPQAMTVDGMQTPSGLETPSGMASVVSTVAGGLETPDFLELRKNASRPTPDVDSGPRSLYQVVPEKQTSVRGLMGSERGYDVSAVSSGSAIPVLGSEERSNKVRFTRRVKSYVLTSSVSLTAPRFRRRRFHRCGRAGRYVYGGPAPQVRSTLAGLCWCAGLQGGLLGHDSQGDVEQEAEGGQGQGETKREGLQVLGLLSPCCSLCLPRPLVAFTCRSVFCCHLVASSCCRMAIRILSDSARGPWTISAGLGCERRTCQFEVRS